MKRLLTEIESAECSALREIFLRVKKETKLTQEAAAHALGLKTQGAVSQYLNGKIALNLNVAIGFANLLGCMISDFSPRLAKMVTEHGAVTLGKIEGWDSKTPLHEEDIELPLYKEVEMAAGSGTTHAVEINGRKLRFALSTLRAAGVDPSTAACATVTGNSMERLINDGATIGIDRSRTQIKDGKIYAIDHGGMLRVKALYRMPGGGLRLHSENEEEHPDEIYTAEQVAKEIKILGWVFWWSQIATW